MHVTHLSPSELPDTLSPDDEADPDRDPEPEEDVEDLRKNMPGEHCFRQSNGDKREHVQSAYIPSG